VLDAFAAKQGIQPGRVGNAETLLDQRALVEYATEFFHEHP